MTFAITGSERPKVTFSQPGSGTIAIPWD